MAHSNTRLPVQRPGARRQRLGQAGVDGVAHAGHRQQGLGFLNGAAMRCRPWREVMVGGTCGRCGGSGAGVLFWLAWWRSGRLSANRHCGHVAYLHHGSASLKDHIPHKSKGPTNGRASRRYTGLQSPCCVTASRGGLQPTAAKIATPHNPAIIYKPGDGVVSSGLAYVAVRACQAVVC